MQLAQHRLMFARVSKGGKDYLHYLLLKLIVCHSKNGPYCQLIQLFDDAQLFDSGAFLVYQIPILSNEKC